jgi:hypothetical protein
MGEEKTDVVVLGPPTPDGQGVRVLRATTSLDSPRVETGELRALKEGKPITGEVLTLEPRKENPRVCDVKSSWKPPAPEPSASRKGPAQVATQTYRDNWDEVFGSTAVGRLPS